MPPRKQRKSKAKSVPKEPTPSPEPSPSPEPLPVQEEEVEVKKDKPNWFERFEATQALITETSTKAVEALGKYIESKKSDALFKDESTRIFLNVTAFKTPTLDGSFFNILLRNSIHAPDSDVVLIIKHDKKRTKNEEGYVEPELKASLFKQKLLTDHGIKIREVITLEQLRDDYSTFEAKRAFLKRIDVLLVDKTIVKHIPGILGRELYKRKKFPVAVSLLETRNVAVEIEKALRKTVLHVNTRGKVSSVIIGNDELSTEELVENIGKVCFALRKKYPGGWKNVSKLSISAMKVPPLVIYFSTGAVEDVTKSVKKSRKGREEVEGEISTQLHKRIKIDRFGGIKVKEAKEEDD